MAAAARTRRLSCCNTPGGADWRTVEGQGSEGLACHWRDEDCFSSNNSTKAQVEKLAVELRARVSEVAMTRVLIADDHEVVRRGLRELLADELPQLKVGEAGRGQEVIEAIQKQEWDIVLLDINLPGRSGLDVLAEIKGLQPKLPVLVLSASPEEDYALRSLKLGAAGYLTKQSASDELMAAVRKALAGGKYVSASLAEKLAANLANEAPAAPHELLSNRELQVLRMIATGRTIKEIAAELALSEKTIATYRARISEKLRLSTNVELARYALQHRLVD